MFTFNKRRARSRHLTARMRPRLEALEGRVVLSTFNVDTFGDVPAERPKISPVDRDGRISLRSAIEFADDHPTAGTTIVVPEGTYNLAAGELDISANLTIKGSTMGPTVVNGQSLDRVFDISSGNVAISNVLIENGRAAGEGAGLLISGGTVTLTSVTLSDNDAVGKRGATGADGVSSSTSGGHGGTGGAGTIAEGGGIFVAAGSVTLTNCSINNNEAIGGNGGTGGFGGFAGGLGIAGNGKNGLGAFGGAGGQGGAGADGEGGGIFISAGASLTLSGDTFSGNKAIGGGGGAGGGGGITQAQAGGNDNSGAEVAGTGGEGHAGAGGLGGAGGFGAGGGLFNEDGVVTFSNSPTNFDSNQAIGGSGGEGGGGGFAGGGAGGDGFRTDTGGTGGNGLGGAGAPGGPGGAGEGGAVFNLFIHPGVGVVKGLGGAVKRAAVSNAAGGSIFSTTAVLFVSNSALGGHGGTGGAGGVAMGGQGGTGGNGGNSYSGDGGSNAGQASVAGNGAAGGSGGVGEGGGVFNAAGGTITFTAGSNTSSPPGSSFSMNQADGGSGGAGGAGGNCFGGNGGNGGNSSTNVVQRPGGAAGSAFGGTGASGGAGGFGSGGGFYDDGTASFTGVTVDFTQNQAAGGAAGSGGVGGSAQGGNGGNGGNCGCSHAGLGGPPADHMFGRGGNGGNGTGGNGGNSGVSGGGSGGGIIVDAAGVLTLKPSLGAPSGSNEANATDVIASNSANAGGIGGLGFGGAATGGAGGRGFLVGANGTLTSGHLGAIDIFRQSEGGGIIIVGKATADNTSVTGNSAITDPNIDGTLST